LSANGADRGTAKNNVYGRSPFQRAATLAPPLGLPPVTALSLNGIRRKIEALMTPDEVEAVLNLDRAARRERDQRSR
jgi:hypothetical protein